ncbi:MAG: hypothetical protein PHX68_00020 [Alphaproteobacteria bacterium]|nr:hypothetical protein [Alphaproteobacteria bacterium]
MTDIEKRAKWAGFVWAVESARDPDEVAGVVAEMTRDARWNTIDPESYHRTLAKIRRESPLPDPLFQEAVKSAESLAKLVQTHFKDFGVISEDIMTFLMTCAMIKVPEDQMSTCSMAFLSLYKGLSHARQKIFSRPRDWASGFQTR